MFENGSTFMLQSMFATLVLGILKYFFCKTTCIAVASTLFSITVHQITLENYKQCFLIMCWFHIWFGLELFRFILISIHNAKDIYNNSMFPKLDVGHNNGFWNNLLIIKFTRCDNLQWTSTQSNPGLHYVLIYHNKGLPSIRLHILN